MPAQEAVRPKVVRLKLPAGFHWHRTGVELQQGESVTIAVTYARWTADPAVPPHDAIGNPQRLAGAGSPHPGANEGALVGRVGDYGAVFVVGNGITWQAAAAGELQLMINEHPAALADNHGALALTVTRNGQVRRAGERASLDFATKGAVLVSNYLPPDNDLTVCAWVKARTLRPGAVIVSNQDVETGGGFVLALNAQGVPEATITEAAFKGGHVIANPHFSERFAADEWRFVSFVRQGLVLSMVLEQASQTTFGRLGPLDTAQRHLAIGAALNLAGGEAYLHPWDGQIAEVSIWSRALTQAELQRVKARQLPLGSQDNPRNLWRFDADLRHYWRLDEGQGAVIGDATLRAPGHIQGEATWRQSYLPQARVWRKNVLARAAWQSSDIIIHSAGAEPAVIRAADGEWTADEQDGPYGANGSGAYAEANPVPGAATGALLAAVGDRLYATGSGDFAVPPGAAGPLKLRINDADDTLGDNHGRLDVVITVPPTTEGVFPAPEALRHYAGSKNSLIAQANQLIARQQMIRAREGHEKVRKAHEQAHAALKAAADAGEAAGRKIFFARNDGAIAVLEGTQEVTRIALDSLAIEGREVEGIALGLAVNPLEKKLYCWRRWVDMGQWKDDGVMSAVLVAMNWDGTEQQPVGYAEYSDINDIPEYAQNLVVPANDHAALSSLVDPENGILFSIHGRLTIPERADQLDQLDYETMVTVRLRLLSTLRPALTPDRRPEPLYGSIDIRSSREECREYLEILAGRSFGFDYPFAVERMAGEPARFPAFFERQIRPLLAVNRWQGYVLVWWLGFIYRYSFSRSGEVFETALDWQERMLLETLDPLSLWLDELAKENADESAAAEPLAGIFPEFVTWPPKAVFMDEERELLYWLYEQGYALQGDAAGWEAEIDRLSYETAAYLSGAVPTRPQPPVPPLAMALLITDVRGKPLHGGQGGISEYSSPSEVVSELEPNGVGYLLGFGKLGDIGETGTVESLAIDFESGWAHTILRAARAGESQVRVYRLPFRIDRAEIGQPELLYEYDARQAPEDMAAYSRLGQIPSGLVQTEPAKQLLSEGQRAVMKQQQEALLKKNQAIAAARERAQADQHAKRLEKEQAHTNADARRAGARHQAQADIAAKKKELAAAQDNKQAQITARQAGAARQRAAKQAEKESALEGERQAAREQLVDPAQRKLDDARRH